MAANKFPTLLHKNCPKIVVILVYTILEWILILLLLLNSLFSYFIQKFTKYFGLKPFCTFCSTLDHIFDSRKHKNSHLDHVCEAHMIEISKLSYCSNHHKLSESKNICSNCSSMYPLFSWISRGVSEDSEHDEEDNRCSCCNEILSRKIFEPTWDVLDYYQKKASFVEVTDAEKDLNITTKSKSLSQEDQMSHEIDQFEEKKDDEDEDDESVYITDMLLQNAGDIDSDRFICIELIDTEPLMANSSEDVEDEDEGEGEGEGEGEEIERPDNFSDKLVEEEKCSLEKMESRVESSFDGSVTSDKKVEEESMTIEDLKSALKAKEKALNALYAELEEERKAAAVAANETMAMITKLQEEKAAVKVEALQYQRMMEEQAEYDQEALQLLNDLMIKREKEKQELEKELEVYRNKVLGYETREKFAIVRSSDSRFTDHNECDDGGVDSDQECDLDDGLEGFEDMDIPDISLAEFDEERVSILEELKALEAKLYAFHDDETQTPEDVGDFGVFRHEDTSSNGPNMTIHFDGKTEDFSAKTLLPLFDAAENEFAEEEIDKMKMDKSKFFIQEELGHVYERLQALEADKEFLKHCISSMMKGNKGLSLLQEILQHLRDLKSVELSAKKLAEIPLEKVALHKED